MNTQQLEVLKRKVMDTVPGSEEERLIREQSEELRNLSSVQENSMPHILIIENDSDWQNWISRFFKKKGYNIRCISSYKELESLLDKEEKDKFAIIFMNIHLEDIRKEYWLFEWTTWLMEIKTYGTHVIVLTSQQKTFERDIFRITQDADYGVSNTFFKENLDQKGFANAIQRFLN